MLLSTRRRHETRRRETDVSIGCHGKPVEVVAGKPVDLQLPTTSTNRAGENGPFEGRCWERNVWAAELSSDRPRCREFGGWNSCATTHDRSVERPSMR